VSAHVAGPADYQNWVEAFARNTPIVWAEKGVRKEDHVLAWQRRMSAVSGVLLQPRSNPTRVSPTCHRRSARRIPARSGTPATDR
jgi:hypothetical protein